jgi:ribosomal protein S18 acetylase RimI-like enzyme
MTHRIATLDDCQLLAGMNQQLLQDERHRNRFMTLPQLEERMRGFLSGEYRAVIFQEDGAVVAYALYREQTDEIYLRQLFVARDRRRRGLGRRAMEILRADIWPKKKRLTVDVLLHNTSAIAFWRAVGYKDYLLGLEIPADSSPSA